MDHAWVTEEESAACLKSFGYKAHGAKKSALKILNSR